MSDIHDQAIIPLSHIDNYFRLRKVVVSESELEGQVYKSIPSWACHQSILEMVSGIEPDNLYLNAGVEINKSRESILISINQCINILNQVREILPFDHLGLAIGKIMTLSHHGHAGIAVMTQDTLEDCIKTACRFGERLFPPLSFRYEELESSSNFSIEESISLKGMYPFFMEIKITSFYYILKHLMGEDYEPDRICFGFSEPEYSSVYKRYFKCPVEFDQARTEIILSKSLVKSILPLANRFMAIQAENTLFETLPASGISLLPIRLRKLLLKSYGAFPSLDDAATKLGMSGRTLRRKLSEDGKSYQLILNDVRCQLSKELLQNKSDSITGIAYLLGFKDSSSFTNAFKKWTGVSPSQYRRTLFESLELA